MRFIRFIIRGLITWSLLFFVLGAAFAASPRAGEDLLGLLGFCVVAGGVVSLVLRRPSTVPAARQPAHAPIASDHRLVEAAPQIPGARGARMALGHRPAQRATPDALAVSYRGQIKAYVTRESWHPVDAFADLGPEDAEYRLVALMSEYAQTVLLDGGVYTEQDAIAYALGELVPHELLERDLPDPSHTAAALRLPADVLTPQSLHALRALITEHNAQAAAHNQRSAE